MSRASGAVRFGDGTILFFLYNGTCDQVWPELFDTSRQSWDSYGENIGKVCTCGGAEPVRLTQTYGGGSHWAGTACKTCRVVVTGKSPFDDDPEEADGYPEWSPFVDPFPEADPLADRVQPDGKLHFRPYDIKAHKKQMRRLLTPWYKRPLIYILQKLNNWLESRIARRVK